MSSPGPSQSLHSVRDLGRIVENVLRLAKLAGAGEAEVHIDETTDALTRFANNEIHQNVAEQGLTISIRTATDWRTARATTNRTDEDSLRGAIEASLSLAHSQPRDPRLLPMPGRQRYRTSPEGAARWPPGFSRAARCKRQWATPAAFLLLTGKPGPSFP